MRTYADNLDSFIRVSFVDENRLQYQNDRDVDGPDFINRWVRRILRDVLPIAGRRFHFLAYSQSALKSHTVWFVKAFNDHHGQRIDAPTIISRLGNFHNLEFDPQLIYCPARYGARVSQAFTTTDASIRIEAEEINYIDDVKSPGSQWCFTDGVGTISKDLAREIWREQQRGRRRVAHRIRTFPRCFQIRFMGSKGMLSVDYKLSGNIIGLRPSMIKFEAPESREIEIAQAFVRPSKYYLNRPLIMILEGLGVRYSVFQKLQDAAVRDIDRMTESFSHAARTMEQFGLGGSYRLPSVLQHLYKLGVLPPEDDTFYYNLLKFSRHHILRDLKHHARIPVPNGYTLVGVADIHGYLAEDEIFACIEIPETRVVEYLDGPVLISRSPTIHPGDIQMVHAIGRPPPNSPFFEERLPNSVVFSIKGKAEEFDGRFVSQLHRTPLGDRPLPSYLGGGDLDGDVYNVTPMKELHPPECNQVPAEYIPATKKLLPQPSTMEDVADFVADYINNDVRVYFWSVVQHY